MRSGKSSYLNDLDVNKPFVEVIFTKKWKAETPQDHNMVKNLRISNQGYKRYLQMHLLAKRIVFRMQWSNFLNEGGKSFVMAPMLPLDWPTFFLYSHLRSMGNISNSLSYVTNLFLHR
jgi:hypothetical protein